MFYIHFLKFFSNLDIFFKKYMCFWLLGTLFWQKIILFLGKNIPRCVTHVSHVFFQSLLKYAPFLKNHQILGGVSHVLYAFPQTLFKFGHILKTIFSGLLGPLRFFLEKYSRGCDTCFIFIFSSSFQIWKLFSKK